ncbi:uncharacterized protein LOC133035508 [Cannabis sativa]|uniref:uncharacterized protein LOC133035508 n=1 Tax=Cannabis sativa TaxID=3483 RepID=UPI0029C9C08C|nr:uncharacterized protein LOC133035508 [Cannabis sativa]
MVTEILQEDAEIPVPLEEFRYVRDVYQMFLPWPKHLILTTEGPLAQPPSRRDASKGKAPMLSPESRGAREDELFTEEKMALIPNSLKWMIHEFLRLKDKRDIITISVPRGFIAPRTRIILCGEDLRRVATLNVSKKFTLIQISPQSLKIIIILSLGLLPQFFEIEDLSASK